jgi:hypothetical protein
MNHQEANAEVDRSTDGVNWTNLTPTPLTGGRVNNFTDTTASPLQAYRYRIVVQDNADGGHTALSATSDSFTATSWVSAHIGSSAGGSAGVSGDGQTLSVQTTGQGIGGTSDDFRYVFRTLTGDGEIVAHVSGFANTSLPSSAGVMFREPASPTSAPAANAKYVTFTRSTNGYVAFSDRPTVGGGYDAPNIGTISSSWLKLVRAGSQFTAYTSSDGATWTQAWQANVQMGQTLDAGLVTAASGYGASNTATLDHISVIAADHTLPSGWSNAAINPSGGTPTIPGSARFDPAGGTFTVETNEQNVGGTADSFNYTYQSFSGDGQLIARVASVSNSGGLAKAGVMIRQSATAPDSPYALMAITAGGSAVFQYRTTTGGSSTETYVTGNSAPKWVKLVRSSGSFSGYVSADGVTWTQVGSAASFTMNTSATAGLSVSAAGYGNLNTSSFDNVAVSPSSLSAPSNLVASASGRTHVVRLIWSQVTGATGYVVERGDGSSPTTWTAVGTTGNTAELNTSRYGSSKIVFFDGTAKEYSTYSYRVRTLNGPATSLPSSTATATTAQMRSMYADLNTNVRTDTNGIEDIMNVNMDSLLSTHHNYRDPFGSTAQADVMATAKSLYEAGYRTFDFDQENIVWFDSNDPNPDYDSVNDVNNFVYTLDLTQASAYTKRNTWYLDYNASKAVVDNSVSVYKTWIQWFRAGLRTAINYNSADPGQVGLFGGIPGSMGDPYDPVEITFNRRVWNYLLGYDTDANGVPTSYTASKDITANSSGTSDSNGFDFLISALYQPGDNPALDSQSHHVPDVLPIDVNMVASGEEYGAGDQVRLDLPIYQYNNPNYVFGVQAGVQLPTDLWKENLAEIRRASDGFAVFNLTASQIDPQGVFPSFRGASNTAATAPTNLQINAAGMHLSWTNPDSTAWSFVVERSVGDANHFVPVGGTTAGTSSPATITWDDPDITTGTRYYYRVRAVNAFGNSALSAVVSAAATRDADAINQANTFDGASSLFAINWGYGFQRNNYYNPNDYYQIDHGFGQWVKYSATKFSGTESQITLNYATPVSGGHLEVWIDQVPGGSGSALMSITAQNTGGYAAFASYTLSLPSSISSGVHDLYLYSPDGFANLAWFKFL